MDNMENYNFNVEKVTKDCIQWIRDWFEKNGKGCNAIIGISGGKDSTVVAKLCAEALGPDRVIGVSLPDNNQSLNDADKICAHLGIRYFIANIGPACDGIRNLSIVDDGMVTNGMWTVQAQQNLPARIRMTMLYALSQTYNARVANTCNLSEDYVGYATLYGDSAGSFAPISKLTVTEIYQIGDYLGLPYQWVHKTPDDGLPHSSSDEEKFGFTYAELDKYIREGIKPIGKCSNSDEYKFDKIKRMYENNKFKTKIIQIPCFKPVF